MNQYHTIELRDISHRYTEEYVLDEINLTIDKGEIFGLLGPSGAGKTTMIQILTGQLKQTLGTAYLLGEDTLHLKRKSYQKIGMMLDNCGFYERLSCYDNLRLFTKLYDLPKERIEEVLEDVGLLEAKKRPAMNLSKGMKQRLLLARAIMCEPQILFLDEPTSGLDPKTALQIHQLIRKQQEKGTTIFLTTHNMEEARKLCNHIALLYKGNIVESGEPKEICNRYNHQNKLHLLLHDGSQIELSHDGSAADIVARYLKEEKIETIHSSEPDLETVFMELTGRGFE